MNTLLYFLVILFFFSFGALTYFIFPKDYTQPAIATIVYNEKEVTQILDTQNGVCITYSWYTHGKFIDQYHTEMDCN